MELTTESVLALAPDDSSVKAARGLVAPGKWPTLGFDDAVVWGECKGSGAKPYQVEVELSGPTFKCSCPSRKFPCKHALALLLLRLAHEASFSRGEAPDWVKEWLDSRQKRAARQEEKKEKGQPADPAAAARREASRLRRMAAGLDDLERWMCDIVRHGLDQLENDSRWAEETAARMVDAQLPGIAARLRSLHGVTFSRGGWTPGDWTQILLAQFGQFQLLIDAFRRIDALPPAEQQDIRAALGLAPDKDTVLASGERVRDEWLVLGVSHLEEDKLWSRRVWLRGQAHGRTALLLDFSHGGKQFDQSFLPGSLVSLTLAFYPGAAPLRAIAAEAPVLSGTAPVPTVPLRAALEDMARRVAAQPWLWPLPMLVSDGIPSRKDDVWYLQTPEGDCLPLELEENDGWRLLAQGGGSPLSVWGEWDGLRLRPVSAWEPGASGAPLWREGIGL